MKKPKTVELTTPYEEDLQAGAVPFSSYPRPQMKRNSYLCLNGEWDFSVFREGKELYRGRITVPFPPESRLSGVQMSIGKKDLLVYERDFVFDGKTDGGRLLLHIGACDQTAHVFVNGRSVGGHIGGYLPFTPDITEAVKVGTNRLRIEASDPMDITLPYGKQTDKRGGMWYTKISGIWQTVWLERVPNTYIHSIRITPDLHGIDLTVTGGEEEKRLLFDGREYRFHGDTFRLDVENPILWTPEHPHLYPFALVCGEDRIESYFALRTVSTVEKDGKTLLTLNGKPFFFHGLLDQGYFSDGIFLPASPRGFEEDILRMKACGFNTLRKHIKLEPSLFYHLCDKHGMLVFQDMINSGRYSFLLDTALPTVFLKKGISHRASPARRKAFEDTCRGIVEQVYNHPSVVYYTVFNEGWGQYEAKAWYKRMKELDPTRICDTVSGWFKTDATDVESDHVYFKPVTLKAVKGRASVLSEFGGYAYMESGHVFCPDKPYGYRFFSDRKAWQEAICALYEKEILPAVDNGLCGAVLTQLSDVEDETNGLLSYDRRVLKVDCERMKQIADALSDRFEKAWN